MKLSLVPAPHDPSRSLSAKLTLQLLGPTQIALNGAPIRFPYEHVFALLAYLVVESDRSHRRGALAGLLWPDQAESAARHSLSQALFSLRRTLQDDPDDPLIVTTRDTVRFNPQSWVWCDVAVFRTLLGISPEQAVANYGGDFLEGLGVGGSAEFEEWAVVTRERLREQACAALCQLTERERWADADKASGYSRRWVELDPLCEEAHRRTMALLAQIGQRAGALVQYERCRELLHAELGIAPDPETMALYEELKQSAAQPRPRPVQSPGAALPLPPTRLVGRERELAEVGALLSETSNRLITLTGPGGVGKTRLALHAALAAASLFSDGARFVPLGLIRDSEQMSTCVAWALGLEQNNAPTLDQRLSETLAHHHMLLLIDNCEHLLPAVATLVADILAAAPRVVILATSRTTLRLSHERRYQLAPLSLGCGDQADGAELAQPAAVELFVERAQAVRPTVERDYPTIHAICRRLDGLPLAIELAARRTRLLNPRALLERLEQRLPLLSGGPRDLPERHQTLYAAIEWSYQLLEPHQQALFRRLAIFVGGWTLAAAEAIAQDLEGPTPLSVSLLDDLAALLDASLITESADGAGTLRWSMLETIHEYAYSQLVAQGELHHVQDLHAHYVATFAAQAAPELSGPAQLLWLGRCDDEQGNLRAALGWCREHAVGLGLRLAGDLHRFWATRGYRREGRDWLETLLQRNELGDILPGIEERAYGLLISGMHSMFLHELELATSRLHESLVLYQQLGNREQIAWVLNNLGTVALFQGAYPEAEQYYRRSLALRTELNHTLGMAACLNNIAEVTRAQGDPHTARAYYDQSLGLYRQAGDQSMAASVMGHIATMLLQQGEYAEARQLYEASHVIAQELGNKPGIRQTLNGLGNVARRQRRYGEAKHYYRQSLTLSAEIQNTGAVTLGLFCLAAIAWAEHQAEHAAVLLGAAAALNEREQITHDPEDIQEFEEHVAAVRAALQDATFEQAWTAGQTLSLEQAVALALDRATDM